MLLQEGAPFSQHLSRSHIFLQVEGKTSPVPSTSSLFFCLCPTPPHADTTSLFRV